MFSEWTVYLFRHCIEFKRGLLKKERSFTFVAGFVFSGRIDAFCLRHLPMQRCLMEALAMVPLGKPARATRLETML